MSKSFIILVAAALFVSGADCMLLSGVAYSQNDYYQDDAEYYEEAPPQQSGMNNMLKQGLLGAGTGAIASGASGGNAGQGALIGAGTGIIGGMLLDSMTQPAPQPRRVYRRAPAQQPPPQQYAPQPQYQQPQVQQQNIQVSDETAPEGGKKKVIKKYDDKGKLISEEEIYY